MEATKSGGRWGLKLELFLSSCRQMSVVAEPQLELETASNAQTLWRLVPASEPLTEESPCPSPGDSTDTRAKKQLRARRPAAAAG